MNIQDLGIPIEVLLQTNFTNPAVVYDSTTPSVHGNDISDMVMNAIKPVVQVRIKGDNTVLYKSGEWYDPQGKWWLLGFGAVALIGIFALASRMSGRK